MWLFRISETGLRLSIFRIDLRSALAALIWRKTRKRSSGRLRDTAESAGIVLAAGEGSVAVGGDFDGTIVTGDNNLVLTTGQATAEALVTLFPPRRHQLPPDLGDFTGRDSEIKTTCRAAWRTKKPRDDFDY